MKVSVAMLTDVGRVRTGNEDAVLHRSDPNGQRGDLIVVADGMGGAEAGEIASRLATQTVADVYFASPDAPGAALTAALSEANGRVLRAPSSGQGSRGMGTTCTALALHDGRAYVAYVGDSRAYLIRGADLQRLTRDESVWADDVRRGGDPAQKFGRNQILRAVGLEAEIECETPGNLLIQPGDRFLLCTDGLWGLVTDFELLNIASNPDLDAVCKVLVALANSRGGHDNITIALAQVATVPADDRRGGTA